MSRASAETPAPPETDPRLREAFAAFCEFFGFRHDLDGRVSFVAPIGDLDGDPLRAIPARLHRTLLSPEASVHVVDLHGKRAREAEALLENLEGDVAVVFFGKGKGVLRNVFARNMAAQDAWLVAGYSGHTADENVPGVAVLIARALQQRLLDDLLAPAEPEAVPPRPRRAARAGEQAPAPSRKPRSTRPRTRAPGRRAGRGVVRTPAMRRVLVAIVLLLVVVFTLPLVIAWFAVLLGYG